MEDDNFVRELKEGAIKKRLPKAEDFDSVDYTSFELSEDKEIEKPITEENIEPLETGETFKDELLNKVSQLHHEGKTVNEICSILLNQGYPDKEIENCVYNIVKNKPVTETKKETEEVPTTELKQADFAPPGQNVTYTKTPTTALEQPAQNIRSKEVLSTEFAPLFVKIDKYHETTETLEKLKNYLNGMSKLFEVANELERIRASNISALNKMYNRTSETASKLYSGLLKPKGMKLEGEIGSKVEVDKLDGVISDLNKELSILREEINKIKGVE